MIKNKKAFTLIELIVTIAVLGILVLLASPRFFGHTQNAELTKGFANAKSIEKASELYYMDHKDWPRLTDEPYTSEEIESYSERIFDNTGHEVNLDPEGNYYDIDYDKLSDYIQVPDDKKNYILQNPVGKVFYMENLNETGKSRVDYNQVIKNDEEQEDTFEFTATFTNAGSTGRTGPSQSQLNRAYSGTSLAGQVTSSNGIQLWTVPKSGTYKIETYGAQGGGARGGIGAIIKGEFSLTKEETIKILVGQRGLSEYGEPNVTSGGGGSFVVRQPYNTNESILAISGGGGGSPSTYSNNRNATVYKNGMSGAGYTAGSAGGSNGQGGLSTARATGGGGFFTDGQGGSGGYGSGGFSFLNGGYGATITYQGGGTEGGFGGGGHSIKTGFRGAGGGGGYSGGGSGSVYSNSSNMSGGGGGSYNSGANKENSVGNTGHGKVIITYIGE